MNLAGLLLTVLAVGAAYLLAVAAARRLADGGPGLPAAFVGSLLPIALVYAISHYFTLLLVQGQALIPLASAWSSQAGNRSPARRRSMSRKAVASSTTVASVGSCTRR